MHEFVFHMQFVFQQKANWGKLCTTYIFIGMYGKIHSPLEMMQRPFLNDAELMRLPVAHSHRKNQENVIKQFCW